MADQAQVRSVEVFESLRAAFIQYQAKSRRAVDMALEEVTRTRQWLQVERRTHWETQIRNWTRQLERAKAELMTVRLSAMVDRSSRHEEAVRHAERQLQNAQEKLKQVKRWSRDFDTATGPHVRRLESVREHYLHDLPKAAAWLHQVQVTLEAYAESRFSGNAAPAGGEGDSSPSSPASPGESGTSPFIPNPSPEPEP